MKKYTVISTMLIMIICIALNGWAQPLTLRPQWVPQTQFAGYYAAVHKGFYTQEGLELQIKDGGPGFNALEEVAAGKTTFGTGWLITAMKMRGAGQELVNICQLSQKSALVLVAHRDLGITSIEGLAGRTVGIWPGDFQVPPRTLAEMKNLDIKFVDQGFSIDPFMQRKVDAASAMVYNEYLTLLEKGVDPQTITVLTYNDVGMNFPEDGIYVRQDFLAQNPQACQAFVRASIKGWHYAFANPDEIARLITDKANQTPFKTTFEHQKSMLLTMQEQFTYRVGADGMGDLARSDFDFVNIVLQHSQQLQQSFTFEDFYSAVK